MSDIQEQIRSLLFPILESLGLILWDLEFRKNGPAWLLRVYIDREGSGATLDDCTAVSRDLSALLDVEDVINHAYTLEVSTPGLDRALTRREHYQASVGNIIKIKTFDPINGQKVFRGRLAGMEGSAVLLDEEQGKSLIIPLDNVAKASWEIVLAKDRMSS